jgi:hypothetical protein
MLINFSWALLHFSILSYLKCSILEKLEMFLVRKSSISITLIQTNCTSDQYKKVDISVDNTTKKIPRYIYPIRGSLGNRYKYHALIK